MELCHCNVSRLTVKWCSINEAFTDVRVRWTPDVITDPWRVLCQCFPKTTWDFEVFPFTQVNLKREGSSIYGVFFFISVLHIWPDDHNHSLFGVVFSIVFDWNLEFSTDSLDHLMLVWTQMMKGLDWKAYSHVVFHSIYILKSSFYTSLTCCGLCRAFFSITTLFQSFVVLQHF